MISIGKAGDTPDTFKLSAHVYLKCFSFNFFLIPSFNIALNSLGMSISKNLGLRGVSILGVRGKRLGSGEDACYICYP